MRLPDNFSFVWEDKIAGSAHPGMGGVLTETLGALRTEGVGAILTLTESPLESALLEEYGMASLHLPIRDFHAPTQAQADRAVVWTNEQIEAGRAVLAHCFAGYGRTGTILACLLVARGLEGPKAISEIRRLRPGSLETPEQELLVLEFAHRNGL